MEDSEEKKSASVRPMGVKRKIEQLQRPLPIEIRTAFDSDVPDSESAMWAAMSADQRNETLRRLRVLLKFEDPNAIPPTVDRAAEDAGLSLNRYYEVHAAWRASRSLVSLGTFAKSPRNRTLSYHADLAKLAVDVVDAAPSESVRKQALSLGEAYARKRKPKDKDTPSYNTLRKFVENERRRRAVAMQPGNAVMFDCCACQLPHSDEIFFAFLIIDKGSRLVLGAWLYDIGDSQLGYSFAAANAIERISSPPLNGLPWAEEMEASEVVVGLDADFWGAKHEESMRSLKLDGQLRPVTSSRRFGIFIRQLIGDRMGRVKFLPGQSKNVDNFAEEGVDEMIRFLAEVDAYNAGLIEAGTEGENWGAPAALLDVLNYLTPS